jgi:DMSO reductase anchor subunit
MIYRVPARPAWNRLSTTLRFFGSGYLGFLLVALVLSDSTPLPAILAVAMLIGLYQLHLIYEEMLFYKYLQEDTPNYYQLSRTKRLLEEYFLGLKRFRIISLGVFGVLMPLVGLVFALSNQQNLTTYILIFALFGAFLSEIVGRYLFYRVVVPTGLAGNFFAGNQRG